MAGRLGPLSGLARRIAGPQAVMPLRSGIGPTITIVKPPTKPLLEEDELSWDDGSVNPEPCLDEFNLVTKYQALGACLGGMALFAGIGLAATVSDKASRVPFAPRVYPYDNLKTELGGDQRVL